MNRYFNLALIALIMSTLISCGDGSSKLSQNPLLSEWDTPFGIAPFDKIRPSHYLEAFDRAFEELAADVEQIVASDEAPTFGNVIGALDSAGVRLRELRDLYEMSEAAMADDEFRRVSEQLMPRITAADDAVLMNEALFERIRAVYDSRKGLEPMKRRLTELTYDRFIRGGALLDSEQKSRLAEINSQEALLSAAFTHNLIAENESFVLDLNSTKVKSLPVNVRYAAREEATRRGLKDRWVFTLNPSSMLPFLSTSNERELREAIYKAYVGRGSNGGEHDNRQIVRDVTKLRQERAQLLGYDNHADYVISQQMAGSVDAAYELLDKVWEPALASAQSELQMMNNKFLADEPGKQFEPWDWWYYAEKVRSDNYGFNDEMLTAYFSAENVRLGAFTLANRLYGITFRPALVPMYHPACVAYEVLDRDNSHLGVLYLDLYARVGKNQGAWCGNLREQRYDGDERVDPVVAMVCNFAAPAGSAPSVLTLAQVETFFHEFGHALHFIFQDVPYHGLAAVEGDFVEFPSQVMESWALHPTLIKEYAFHYSSKKPLTDNLIKKLTGGMMFGRGFETVAYCAAALIDLELHTLPIELCDSLNLSELEHRVLRVDRGMIYEIAPKYHLANFPHLFTYDYAAGYYFYLWAEVLALDCFEEFKLSGDIFSKELADKLRHNILERGSTSDGMTLYKKFKGGEPAVEPMLKSKGLL